MNFLLTEMTFLRYFIPLIIEGNKRGITSKLFVGSNTKYTNPGKYVSMLDTLCKEHNIDSFKISELSKHDGIVFNVEGSGQEHIKGNHQGIALTYMTDYTGLYKRYVNAMHTVIMPSESFAKSTNFQNKKNQFLGSPKYDVNLNVQEIKDKYGLSNSYNVLLINPRNRDRHHINLKEIYSYLKSMGYNIIVVARGKEPVTDKHLRGDKYIQDGSWYPHFTMELIKACDFVVNFSSTSIKECVMLDTPLVNFHIKPFPPMLPFLYEFDFVKNLDKKIKKDDFINEVNDLLSKDLTKEFENCRYKYLFNGNSSERIIDYVENNF